mmetsp:Transcript_4286/g.12074  ORF Transcript_4286/g.12074 Transcript_4286/m.12074 type:complete len:1014 (-) Transcript_4286:107-3148(-)
MVWCCCHRRHRVHPDAQVIKQQSLVMQLSQSVLAETQHHKAIAKLVCAAQDVVNCDRVGFFMFEPGQGLVCQAGPGGARPGHAVELGKGSVGKVALTGETVNIADVRKHECFDRESYRQSGCEVQSVLCVGLKDQAGKVIAAVEAVNKRDKKDESDYGTATVRAVEPEPIIAFDETDEQSLELLLALTHNQLQVLALSEQKARATHQAESLLNLVGSLSTSVLDVDACLAKLSGVTREKLPCQHVFIFLVDGPDLLCYARSSGSDSQPGDRLRVSGPSTGTLHAVVRSGVAAVLGPADHAQLEELAGALQLDRARHPRSALLCPLHGSGCGGDDDLFGVVVALNKLMEFGARDASKDAHADRGGVLSRTLNQILRDGQHRDGQQPQRAQDRLKTDNSGATSFTTMDARRLDDLLSFATHAVRTADMYSRLNVANKQLLALANLCSDSVKGIKAHSVHEVIYALCRHGTQVFNCERCSFFAVDPISYELLGWFFRPEATGREDLQAEHLPMEGAVGQCVNTRQAVNIANAGHMFENRIDREIGDHACTILCQPIKSQNGQVVAVLQCVNKLPKGKPFDPEDDEKFVIISSMFSDWIQKYMSEESMQSVMRRSDVHQDAKARMQLYSNSGGGNQRKASMTPSRRKSLWHAAARNTCKSSFQLSAGTEMACKWDFRYVERADDASLNALIQPAFDDLNLLSDCELPPGSLANFVKDISSDYFANPYHNWKHAVTTFHVIFLLLLEIVKPLEDHEGLELSPVDRLAVLLAALGHDAGHRGYNNMFESSTQSFLAIRYNDHSALENHSASVTCSRLQLSQPALVSTMAPDDAKRARSVIIQSILNTDMARHNESVVWLCSQSVNLQSPAPIDEVCADDSNDSCKLLCALLHCADIGHPCMPWKVHKHFSLLACQEFYNQYQEETRLGLPTLPFMGKDPHGPVKDLGPSQAGFVNFVVLPLYAALNTFSNGIFQHVVDNVHQNKALWKLVGDGEEFQDDEPPLQPIDKLSPRPGDPSCG